MAGECVKLQLENKYSYTRQDKSQDKLTNVLILASFNLPGEDIVYVDVKHLVYKIQMIN